MKQCKYEHVRKGEQNTLQHAPGGACTTVEADASPLETARRTYPTGSLVVANKLPTHDNLHGVEGRVMDHVTTDDDVYVLLEPTSCVSVSMADCMMKNDIPANKLTRMQTEEANSCYLAYENQGIVDTGATQTFVPSERYLDPDSIHELDTAMSVNGPDGSSQPVTKAGTLDLKSNTGMKGTIPLRAFIAPKNNRILVSASHIDDAGYEIRVKNKTMSIYDGDRQFIKLPRHLQVGTKLAVRKGGYTTGDSANRLYLPDECIASEDECQGHAPPTDYDDEEEANVARGYADCDERTLRCGHSKQHTP